MKTLNNWMTDVPNEVFSRWDGDTENKTLEEAIEDSFYVLSVINDGGSYYEEEDPDELKTMRRQIERFIKKYN
ncbi:hypothetical protein [Paenibacillus sp. USHLN196]|uniref:hypothetical protein n=1 Tax=Paenibacillus sp. USHLN196 TaxID=3081291 RepID=UPI00301958EF